MKFSSLRRNLLIIGFAFLAVVTCVRAQTGTTSVRGAVTDKTGAAIVGAKVTIINAAQGLHREAVTDGSGGYEFLALSPGDYSLMIESKGFRKFEQKNLQLLVNSPATVNATLEVGAASEIIEVSAQAVTLNTTDASLGSAFSENQVKELPLEGGNVPELLSLQAGVAYTGNRLDINKDTDTRNGAVNGARSDQSNITLDGVDVNSDIKGYAFQSVLPITQDSVQEFRVTTSNYNADEGRSSGAQVTLVTKSGTNDLHGSVFESHRNTYTSANDYFVKLAELNGGKPNVPPKLIRNIFGGSLGGPIKKDRLFFFVNYQGSRQREAQSVVRIVPSAALQDGVLTYQCADPTQCPALAATDPTAPVGVSGKSWPIQAGYFGLSPAQIKGMDPQGIGISQNVMIPYFQSFAKFVPNDNSVGDGVNFLGYRFSGPVAINTNWYIARADYKITSSGNHTIFWRGALRNDTNGGVPYLPGGGPEVAQVDYSKGYSVGYAAVLRPSLVNNFRYGYTRQSFGQIGNHSADIIFFRGLNDDSSPNNASLAVTNTNSFQVPVHNFVDDLSWIKGRHTLQFGGNINFLRNPTANNSGSFSSASDNPSWLDTAAMANTKSPGHLDPGCSQMATGPCFDKDPVANAGVAHYPLVNSGFGNNYDYPIGALIGMVTQVNAHYNSSKSGGTLADGTPVKRRFAADTWEMYAQDSWKARSNLTITFGLRYSLFSPPWETNGLQVVPNVSLSDFFQQRTQNMLQGLPASAVPRLSFSLGGPANGKPGFYNWDKKDFAPRFSMAWSPSASDGLFKSLFGGPGKTSIRAGAGIVYDRLGPALLATFDRSGSFGMSTALTNTGGLETVAVSPRIAGLTGNANIPTMDLTGRRLYALCPTCGTFPQTFPNGLNGDTGSYAVYFGMDNKLKTPYSYTLDLSIGRDLGHGLTLEAAYVGRLSHRLLSQFDVASPLDLVDPKTKTDYFTAVTALAKLYRQGVPTSSITPAMVGPTASYWYDMIAPLPASNPGQPQPPMYSLYTQTTPKNRAGTTDALKAAYDLFSFFSFNETTALQGIDQGFGLFDPNSYDANGNPTVSYYANGGPYSFVDPQFAALYSWRSVGTASYHALQVNLRKHMSHGFQFDLNYTYSKSIDISSDANRITDEGGLGGQVIKAWDPNSLRAASDFDLRHQINANWIWDLPFGKGRWIANNANRGVDAIIGGWELSGLARWTSGFPIGVSNGAQWPTNWELSGFATQIGPVSTRGAVKNPDGTVNIFGNAAAAAAALANFQADFPGQVGGRNNLRGNGFAGLDLGLSKRWKMPYKESHSLQLRWDVFNALNLTRFDVQSLSLGITNSSNFGNYTGLLTNPRVMQFALRYEF
jgi:Carboxypeptidase regulatory-like domain